MLHNVRVYLVVTPNGMYIIEGNLVNFTSKKMRFSPIFFVLFYFAGTLIKYYSPLTIVITTVERESYFGNDMIGF